ncbi:hypothetical protein RND71_002507 [Anisodus tanguticus]|uniref:U-box domain-containing protein n=1 Tax=Anisodus tanguticus TaxID=243964 RepID=A0AAE1T359_9SOLA|nr:hypothetical protein RND71_002507 [Anisodus tanguticus]
MDEIQIPPYFICPVSLELMKDPVTISTEITYDRENIEKWIFFAKNSTCVVTKQSLTSIELTPNVTLRRFIQSWCTLNASYGIERFPNDANKRSIESARATEFLASIINNSNKVSDEEGFTSTKDEALNVLYQLKLSEHGLRSLIMSGNGEFIASLTHVM